MKWSEVVQSEDLNIATSECEAYTVVKQAKRDTHECEVPTVQCIAYGESRQPPSGDRPPETVYETIQDN